MVSETTPRSSSSTIVRYQRSGTFSSLEGSHKRPESPPRRPRELPRASQAAARPEAHRALALAPKSSPARGRRNYRPCSRWIRSTCTATDSIDARGANSSRCRSSPARPEIYRAPPAHMRGLQYQACLREPPFPVPLCGPVAPSEQVASRHASYRPCAGSCGEGTRHVLSVWHSPSAIHLVATTRAFALATQRERRGRRQCLVATDAIR
jgi:hypothetical protein